MHEYVASGVWLGWLMDAVARRAGEHRPGQDARVQTNPLSRGANRGCLP